MSHGSCVKIENLSPDILEAAKKIVLQRQKDGIVRTDKSGSSELEESIEEMRRENKDLLSKVDKLEQKIDLLLSRH